MTPVLIHVIEFHLLSAGKTSKSSKHKPGSKGSIGPRRRIGLLSSNCTQAQIQVQPRKILLLDLSCCTKIIGSKHPFQKASLLKDWRRIWFEETKKCDREHCHGHFGRGFWNTDVNINISLQQCPHLNVPIESSKGVGPKDPHELKGPNMTTMTTACENVRKRKLPRMQTCFFWNPT